MIFPVNKAVGQRNAKGTIDKYNPENIGGTSIQYADEGFEIIAIDDLKVEETIGFMKIDVEGFEVEAIKGVINTIRKNLPIIYIEICTEENLTAIKELLPEYRYKQLAIADYFFFVSEIN